MPYESDEHFRLAVFDALLAAIEDWDAISDLIAGAANMDAARSAVCEMLGVDEAIAEHVLETPLRRLTSAASSPKPKPRHS